MLHFLFRSLVVKRRHTVISIVHRHIATNSSQTQHSLTVNYLVRTCGLSPESALSASKMVKIETPERADSVLAILENYGFSKPHISKLVKKMPTLLACKPETTIAPKLEFLRSKGFSSSDIVIFVTACPMYLRRSLKNHTVPAYGFLKNLLQSDEKTFRIIKRCPYVLNYDLELNMLPKIKILRDNGVCEANTVKFICCWPRVFIRGLDKFQLYVKEVTRIGFDPSKFKFCMAIMVILSMSTPIRDRKINLYKSWGLSEEEIMEAFRKDPRILSSSAEKIAKSMDVFVNKLGWEKSFLAEHLFLVPLSIEKRLVPRASVLQLLVSKGLVKKEYRSSTFFKCSEAEFLRMMIKRYAEAPELLKVYGKK